MSDILLTIHLPEALAAKAKAANLQLESFIIQSLERDLRNVQVAVQSDPEGAIMPSAETIEAAIQASMRRVAVGEVPLRTLGLQAGTVWMSDDFDDPLPDAVWGDLSA